MWYQRRKEQEMRSEKREEKRIRREKREERKDRKYRKGSVSGSFVQGGYLHGSDTSSEPTAGVEPATSNKWSAELMRYEESLGDER